MCRCSPGRSILPALNLKSRIVVHPRTHLKTTRSSAQRMARPRSNHSHFVFALTGYHPDFDLLKSLSVEIGSGDCRPVCDSETLESNVPGIYLAGVIVAGARTSEIFIENGRFHGRQIAADLARKLSPEIANK